MQRSPRVLKGALVELEAEGEPGRVLVFQYNPESLHRTIERRAGSDQPPGSVSRRTPRELISCSLVFDATDVLERPDEDRRTLRKGISPELAALELLMVGREARKPRWWEFWRSGAGRRLQPLALFVWGSERVVPVRLVRLEIQEVQHDPALRPIRGTVDVTMQVVAEEDLPGDHIGSDLWRRHLATLETLAEDGYSAKPPVEIQWR